MQTAVLWELAAQFQSQDAWVRFALQLRTQWMASISTATQRVATFRSAGNSISASVMAGQSREAEETFAIALKAEMHPDLTSITAANGLWEYTRENPSPVAARRAEVKWLRFALDRTSASLGDSNPLTIGARCNYARYFYLAGDASGAENIGEIDTRRKRLREICREAREARDELVMILWLPGNRRGQKSTV